MKLPSGTVVTKGTPIYPGSHFTWGEATKNLSRQLQDLVINGKLQISAYAIEQKIITAAMALDDYRYNLGNRPIIITSWYRPPHINQRVGGSKFSRHQYGDAVDWRSLYFSPAQIALKLEKSHLKGGFHAYYDFVHTDWRGVKARW